MTPEFVARAFVDAHSIPIHFSNSPPSLALRRGKPTLRRPYSLRRRVRRSPLPFPRTMRGDGAPGGATIVFVDRVPSRERGRLPARHPDKLAQSGLICGRSPYGAGPRFAKAVRLMDGRRQPSSWQAARIGRRAEPRRRPSACLASGTPAGAASCSITKTPLDDALARAERIGLYSAVGL